jgi:SAM-dependent methyltransferase
MRLEPMSDASTPPLHRTAALGFQAGAAVYASGRPDYPRALAGWLAGALGLAAGRTALDLGAGTGKFLPQLLQTGAHVIAVEPVEAMRETLSRAHPEVEARSGTAEVIPVADSALDAIVCAQSFHWFDNAKTLAEMRRTLKPGGRLGLVWNVRDESIGWVAALSRMIEPYEGDAPRFASGRWRGIFPAEGFSSLEETRFPHSHIGPPERVIVERMLSTSYIAALPKAKRAEIAAEVRELISATPELAGRDFVSYPYMTSAFACQKL